MLLVASARTIGAPRPPAPTIDAITTIDRHSMMHWVTPAMIVGNAAGSFTLNSNCQRVEPKASPASTSATGTWLMPR